MPGSGLGSRGCVGAVGASAAGTAASRRQLPVLLLSGSAGTGAERVGVTDTRGLPGAALELGFAGDPHQLAAFWGREDGSVKPPPRTSPCFHRTHTQRGSLGWGSLQAAPQGGERDAMWALYPGNTAAIPNFPVVRFGCPGSPVSRVNGAAGAGCASPPSFPGSISCRAAAWPLPPYQELSQSCRALFDMPVAIGTT